MKVKTAIVLLFLILGAFFIFAPTVLGEIYRHKLSESLLQPATEIGTVFYYFNGPMDHHGQLACWSVGLAFICAALLFRRDKFA
jgi:hypothetical protein